MNSSKMIPKIIHYCWFSGEEKPIFIQKCIKSWHKILPEYKVICWDSNSFDFDCIPYVREAFKQRKWAFVSDYIRFYALYKYGGIYLDSDVEVKKKLDSLLDANFFCGTEAFYDKNGELVGINPDPAQFGSCIGNPILKDCLDYYEKTDFVVPAEGITNIVGSPTVLGRVLAQYGYIYKDEYQKFGNNIVVYPNSVLSNMYTYTHTHFRVMPYTIHHLANSWMSDKERGVFFRLCRDYNMMKLYHWVERKIKGPIK
nr:capsular polysaccharide synthesis protein [Barnesiella sp. An55]